MARRDQGLLGEIERDLLDDTKPLAATLRKCLLLGGQTRSVPLREWASRELNGYEGEDELPEYRRVQGAILVDAIVGNYHTKRQRISSSDLPDFAAEHISETVELRGGAGLLEALVSQGDASGEGAVKLSLPAGAELVAYMNQQNNEPFQQILEVYWGVSTVAIRGVLDQIRTSVVEIISELRAGMPDEGGTPSPELADQAVNVVLHGGKRHQVTVTTAKAEEGSSVSVSPANQGPESRWSKTSAIWTVLGVLVALVGVYLAYRQLKD